MKCIVTFAMLILFASDILASSLSDMPELKKDYPKMPNLSEGDIVVIFAHADDEVLLSPQIAQIRREQPHRKVKWVMVSDNAKGKIFTPCFGKSKAECRRDEAFDAADCMGIDRPEFMNIPDGSLDQIVDLADQIENFVSHKLGIKQIAGIFTHDQPGLYGHPDHMAVHDAVVKAFKGTEIPLVVPALTDYFKKKMPKRDSTKDKVFPDITHALDLSPLDQGVGACVSSAHRSQWVTLRYFMGWRSPETFFQRAPRTFMNISVSK